MMSTEPQLRATVLLNTPNDDIRQHIVDVLDQYYWEDNGGETDGPDYLIETSELPSATVDALEVQHILPIDGTFLDGYSVKKHQKKLDKMNVAWTGWQAERYALINATPEEVHKSLMADKTTVKFTVYRTLEWKSEVDVDDPEDEEELKEAIIAVIPRRSADFHTQIEEYAEFEDNERIDIL